MIHQTLRHGSIGKDVPQPDDDFFILISPQNIQGYAVTPYIIEMEEAAGDRQGLTFVHCSAQRKRCLWDRGCMQGLFKGVFRRC